ncbi:MAG: ABC transporter permease [Solirubrobacterales bacterium]
MTGKTIVATVKPPVSVQRRVRQPVPVRPAALLVSAADQHGPFQVRRPGLQAANFLTLFRALDRLGGFFILASVREFAPVVTAVVVAGVAGTAITADLGAARSARSSAP